MKVSINYPVTIGDVLVDSASPLFEVTEVTAPSLPADVYCGDILNSKTFELFDASTNEGVPFINLSNMSADGKPKTLVRIDRHAVITDFRLRAKDAASKKEALRRITADGSIRLAVNADYYKA
ncbi:hypothetical protein OLZ33_04555 [Pantoea ananatis]|uniref:hypothetical protein n=1 Tax=Pantoea ananas TaxID=553 RepID=UPI001588549B|nr:hypothetical protein [Pantoea ananatis]MBA4819676.1 hypothetical protein [Pantoea ananatis]MCW1831277.1 hypothetical protein [Pantoea ananatis]QKV86527.1 hypothetical protein FOB88_04985 [Pantoea ananatis]